MSKQCGICGKKPLVGCKVSHANNKSKKRSMPNLQRIKLNMDGSIVRKYVCTRCIRTGKFTKAA